MAVVQTAKGYLSDFAAGERRVDCQHTKNTPDDRPGCFYFTHLDHNLGGRPHAHGIGGIAGDSRPLREEKADTATISA